MLTTAHYEVPGALQVIQALGPAFALLAATIAAVIAYGTLQQRRAADAKAEWWRRTQWALTDDVEVVVDEGSDDGDDDGPAD